MQQTMKQTLLRSSSPLRPSVISGSSLLNVLLFAGLAASCGGTEEETSPVHDVPGVVLLDTGDDGNNTPLEDTKAPAGFSSYGFWYTYDDFEACRGTDDPNYDTLVSRLLTPAQGSPFTTTPYSALGIQPPPETLERAPSNTHAMRFTGSGHHYFGAGLGFKFDNAYVGGNPGIDFKAAGYTGIRFWVYSPIPMDYIVKLQDAYSTPEAGLCTPRGPFPVCAGPQNCENAPSTESVMNIKAEATWKLYELYFAEVADDPATPAIEQGPFLRANWDGVANDGRDMRDIPPVPDRIFQLQFQTASAEQNNTFDLILDNVGFIVANGPEDNALGVFEPPAAP